jgi:PilZ domain
MSARPAPDRRAHPRYLCWVEAVATAKENTPQPARLLDLSANGVRIALLRPLETGAELRLMLPRGQGLPNVLTGCVARISRTSTGWEAGCTFDPPLADEQLALLLQSLEAG